MLRKFPVFTSKGFVSNFASPSLDLTLAMLAPRADTRANPPSKITGVGVAWVKNR